MYVCAFQLQVNKESQEGRKDKRYQIMAIPPPGHSLIHNYLKLSHVRQVILKSTTFTEYKLVVIRCIFFLYSITF